MAIYESAPDDGVTTAGDAYSEVTRAESWPADRVDILIENNPAVVAYKYEGSNTFGDGQILKQGLHSIPTAEEVRGIEAVQIKNRNAGNNADHQVTFWRQG